MLNFLRHVLRIETGIVGSRCFCRANIILLLRTYIRICIILYNIFLSLNSFQYKRVPTHTDDAYYIATYIRCLMVVYWRWIWARRGLGISPTSFLSRPLSICKYKLYMYVCTRARAFNQVLRPRSYANSSFTRRKSIISHRMFRY